MLKKHHRLTWADIQMLLRRGKKYYGKHFVCVSMPQSANKPFHQTSIQIPVKLDKRAAWRNLFKRHALLVMEDILLEYYVWPSKIFCFLNKKSLEPLRELVARWEKTHIVWTWKEICKKDFIWFLHALWSDNLWKQRGRGR